MELKFEDNDMYKFLPSDNDIINIFNHVYKKSLYTLGDNIYNKNGVYISWISSQFAIYCFEKIKSLPVCKQKMFANRFVGIDQFQNNIINKLLTDNDKLKTDIEELKKQLVMIDDLRSLFANYTEISNQQKKLNFLFLILLVCTYNIIPNNGQ